MLSHGPSPTHRVRRCLVSSDERGHRITSPDGEAFQRFLDTLAEVAERVRIEVPAYGLLSLDDCGEFGARARLPQA